MNKNLNWYHADKIPDVDRGEVARCWVAVYFERTNQVLANGVEFLPPYARVIELSFANAQLTEEEVAYIEEFGTYPEGTLTAIMNWENDEGEHLNAKSWCVDLGEGGYRVLLHGEDGYYYYPDKSARFRMLCWTPLIAPLFPVGFEKP